MSPDGLAWRKIDVTPIPSSDTSSLMHDRSKNRYVAFVKTGNQFGRAVAMSISKDFADWSHPKLCFGADEEDQKNAIEKIRKRMADPGLQHPLWVDPVYSLGVIFYELLTGRRPFEGTTMAVLTKILNEKPLPPSTHRPDLDPILESICEKAMKKGIGDRYASMGELAEAVQKYLKGEMLTPEQTIRVQYSNVPSPLRKKKATLKSKSKKNRHTNNIDPWQYWWQSPMLLFTVAFLGLSLILFLMKIIADWLTAATD